VPSAIAHVLSLVVIAGSERSSAKFASSILARVQLGTVDPAKAEEVDAAAESGV
jgi:hypothetical protein